MKTTKLLLVLLLALLLAACGGGDADTAPAVESEAPAAASAPAAAELAEDYDDALTVKNQLILGSLRLEGTVNAISAEQAKDIVPLWQLYRSLTESDTTATEETEAVQNQILGMMTAEQIAAIDAMQLTNETLQDYYVEIGVKEAPDETVVSEAEATGVPMRDLSPEAKATAQAERGVVPQSSGRGAILMDNLLELLESK